MSMPLSPLPPPQQTGQARFNRSRRRSSPRHGGVLQAIPLGAEQQDGVCLPSPPHGGLDIHAVHHLGVPPLRCLPSRWAVHGDHRHGLSDHDQKATRREGRALDGSQRARFRPLGCDRAAHRRPGRVAVCRVRHPVGGELRDGSVLDHPADPGERQGAPRGWLLWCWHR